ncbi:MAG: hypothetical protein A2633_01920 [Candidatus Sungbacteria bacterium RIFCSPHIGHO2_01_FULL_47_32]|uniref:Uncharacterized protein n=1 Tax=Candidatus Sungbacteria bacterium RIFCSPHIGHO2_01_FULL_47_32 TaxID=1802264 RepID=A0A1G2K8C5_9BACT|nr:MAG: hypothetical protein UX72_C0034G0022 [Parcubacteria group bacterium GW2011_GWA2_47_10]OGZ95714.1 MAG: hypothetical protein A2633_01920 [Candidatus Sungbacteria bacterium RIFCSPHIGHO2_01_FULL_47_32]
MKDAPRMPKQVFKVDDLVDVKDRNDLTHYGKIKKVMNDNALVHFKLTREPKQYNVCDSCGWPGFLSESGNTGEIECMKSGCGHGHGFEEREELISLEKLINMTALKEKEKMNVILKDIITGLCEAEAGGYITAKTKERIVNLLRYRES